VEGSSARRPFPLGRFVAEGVLIVASILLAFGIQAWWDDRVEQRELRTALVGLRADFVRNLSSLDSARTANEDLQEAARGLLELTGPQAVAPSDAALLPDLVQGVLNRHRFSAYDSHLKSLINTGRWDLIESEALKESLNEWEALVSNLSRREESAVEGINNRLIVRIWELAPMRTLDMPIARFRAEVGPSRFPAIYEPLLRDMYFEAAVDERWQDAFNLIAGLDRLEAVAHRVIALVDEELAG
jgi:hypothetical protein